MKKSMITLGVLLFAINAFAGEEASFPSFCMLKPSKVSCAGQEHQSSGCLQVCSGGKQANCEPAKCYEGCVDKDNGTSCGFFYFNDDCSCK